MADGRFYAKLYDPKPDIVKNIPETEHADYISLPLDPESDLDLTGTGSNKPLISGTIHPFHKSHSTVWGQLNEEFRRLWLRRNVRLASAFIVFNLFVIACLTSWSASSNSLALRSYNYISLFELLGLSTYLISAWSSQQDQKKTPNTQSKYTLGFERVEVLAVFSSVVVAQLGAVFVIKEAVERFIDQPEIHAGRLLPGALLGFIFHVAVSYFVVNHAFNSICEVASSSWMQEHIADMSRGICGVVPMLSTLLLPRVNPFLLISFAAACGVLFVDVLLQFDSYYTSDTLVGLVIALVVIGTMWPITVCSGRVLLHTTPPHVLGQLDKLLSEAQTLDGVLEIKSERFYTLSLGLSGKRGRSKPGITLAGSLRVRVRRDADEQMVLAHVTNRLSSLVPVLTVQVDKDDWITGSSGLAGKISHKISPQIKPHGHPPLTSHYISGFNKPAAAVAPYLQTPPRKMTGSAFSSPHAASAGILSGKDPKDDFCFTSPTKSTPSPILPLMKPRSSQTDIARLYKAAGFSSPPSNSASLGLRSGSFTHIQSGKPPQFATLPLSSKFSQDSAIRSHADRSKLSSKSYFTQPS